MIEAIVRPIITGIGYEYVGTEMKKAGDACELIIYADKKGGISLDDCEKISRLIEPAIDEKDPVSCAYYLCVSSPGLDRPLKNKNDFERSTGKIVDIKLYRAAEGQKEFTGKLEGFDNDGFTLDVVGAEKYFMYKDTAIVKLHVDF
ncbi:MAG: ribosome maturation factor RimP [Eubacteriales bacterium]|nr:ribosome maturation factor RimP [Eubacteriales bacterium]